MSATRPGDKKGDEYFIDNLKNTANQLCEFILTQPSEIIKIANLIKEQMSVTTTQVKTESMIQPLLQPTAAPKQNTGWFWWPWSKSMPAATPAVSSIATPSVESQIKPDAPVDPMLAQFIKALEESKLATTEMINTNHLKSEHVAVNYRYLEAVKNFLENNVESVWRFLAGIITQSHVFSREQERYLANLGDNTIVNRLKELLIQKAKSDLPDHEKTVQILLQVAAQAKDAKKHQGFTARQKAAQLEFATKAKGVNAELAERMAKGFSLRTVQKPADTQASVSVSMANQSSTMFSQQPTSSGQTTAAQENAFELEAARLGKISI